MEKIKLSFFDTFAYLIPGLLIVMSITVAYNDKVKTILDIPKSFEGLTTSGIIFAMLVSYILGIICNFFGHYLYQLAKKIWKKDVIQNSYDLDDTQIHVLIRELSPNNYTYLQSWLGLSNMSHNLAIAMLVLSIISIIKMFEVDSNDIMDWILLLIFCLISTAIFLKRSIRFNNYFKAEKVAAIEQLNLLEKAKKI